MASETPMAMSGRPLSISRREEEGGRPSSGSAVPSGEAELYRSAISLCRTLELLAERVIVYLDDLEEKIETAKDDDHDP